MDWERRLPPFAEDALAVLQAAVDDPEGSLSQAEATTLLAEDDRFTETDAEHALELLQRRGHIYYVEDRVRITPTDK